MATNLNIWVNNDLDDDSPLGSSGVAWVQVTPGSDKLIFTKGSPVVANGQPIPSSFQLSSAGMILNGTQQTVPHYILAHLGTNLLYEVYLMGSGNFRYVMAFDFNGATTSEPVLEAWDDSNLNTVNDVSLGNGTPSNSWLFGVTTTASLPGVSWSGSALAGSSDGHFLWLNNQTGALTGATTLYCTLKMVIPASQVNGGAETPVLVCKYTTT